MKYVLSLVFALLCVVGITHAQHAAGVVKRNGTIHLPNGKVPPPQPAVKLKMTMDKCEQLKAYYAPPAHGLNEHGVLTGNEYSHLCD